MIADHISHDAIAFWAMLALLAIIFLPILAYCMGRHDQRMKRPNTDRELYRMLSQVYTDEAAWKWLDHADEQGWDLQERKRRIEALITGAYL